MKPFVCLSTAEPELLSPEVLEHIGVSTPQELYASSQKIAAAARAICEIRGGRLGRLPFCNTLEAESLGAQVRFEMQSAFVPRQPYTSLQELPAQLCMESPRIDAMLDAVSELRRQGMCVAYGVTGVFTVISQLVPMGAFFKALRKEEGQALLQHVEQACIQYAVRACRAGAQILSYADPVATVDIVGKRTFCTSVAPSMSRLFDGVRRQCPNMLIFLCGKMSQSLLDTGVARYTELPVQDGMCFEQALLDAAASGGDLLGLGCLNRLKAPCHALYQLHFVEKE